MIGELKPSSMSMSLCALWKAWWESSPLFCSSPHCLPSDCKEDSERCPLYALGTDGTPILWSNNPSPKHIRYPPWLGPPKWIWPVPNQGFRLGALPQGWENCQHISDQSPGHGNVCLPKGKNQGFLGRPLFEFLDHQCFRWILLILHVDSGSTQAQSNRTCPNLEKSPLSGSLWGRNLPQSIRDPWQIGRTYPMKTVVRSSKESWKLISEVLQALPENGDPFPFVEISLPKSDSACRLPSHTPPSVHCPAA